MSIYLLPLEIKAKIAELCELSDFISFSEVNDEWYQVCQMTKRRVDTMFLCGRENSWNLLIYDYPNLYAINGVHINYSHHSINDTVRNRGNLSDIPSCSSKFNPNIPTYSTTYDTVTRRLGMISHCEPFFVPVTEYNIRTRHGFRVEAFKAFFKIFSLLQLEFLTFDANILLNMPEDILADYELCRINIPHSYFRNLIQNQANLLTTIFESSHYTFDTVDKKAMLEVPMTENVICADKIVCYQGFSPNLEVLGKLNVQEAQIYTIKLSFADVYRWILETLENSPKCKKGLLFLEAVISGSLDELVDSLKKLDFEFTRFELNEDEGNFDLEYTIHDKTASLRIKKRNSTYYFYYHWIPTSEIEEYTLYWGS